MGFAVRQKHQIRVVVPGWTQAAWGQNGDGTANRPAMPSLGLEQSMLELLKA